MWRPVCLALAITSLLVISSVAAHAQALAPSELHLASHEQETKKYIGQVVTKETMPVITKKSAQAIAKKPGKEIAKKPVQAITRDSARTFTIEPVRPIEKPSTSEATRPVTHYSYKTPQGKKESVPVLTQYYPNRTVYPVAKGDRHNHPQLMPSATTSRAR